MVTNWTVTNLQLTNLQAGREGEGEGDSEREGRAEILSEIAWMQYGLINYAKDKPPGYTMPEIDLVNSTATMPSELQQTRKQLERASKRGRGGGREPPADQWMAAAAAPADGASGASASRGRSPSRSPERSGAGRERGSAATPGGRRPEAKKVGFFA